MVGVHTWQGAPPDRMTDACKNITLPQTPFAGDKKQFIHSSTIAPNLNKF